MVSSAHQCCTWRPSLLALRAGPWAGPLGRIPFLLVRAPKCSFQWGWQRRGVRSAGSSLPTQGAPALKGAEKPFGRAGRLVPGVQPRLRESLGCRGAPISQTLPGGSWRSHRSLLGTLSPWPPPRTTFQCRLRAGGRGSWCWKGRAEVSWPAWGRFPSRGQLCGDQATDRAGPSWTLAPSSCLSEVPASWPRTCTSRKMGRVL